MPRGLPDYYNLSTVVSQRVVDLHTVLSVIMGVGPIDGRGRIAFFDNFKEGLYGWELTKAGNGVAPDPSTSYAELPPVSARFQAGTLGGSGISRMTRYSNLKDLTSVGLEASIRWVSRDSIIVLYIVLSTDTHSYEGTLKIDSSNGVVSYFSGGVDHTIVTLGDLTTQAGWTPFKLVVDFATGRYVRAVIGQASYDISGPIPDSGPSLVNYQLRTTIEATGNDTVTAYAYCGHAVVTTDEP